MPLEPWAGIPSSILTCSLASSSFPNSSIVFNFVGSAGSAGNVLGEGLAWVGYLGGGVLSGVGVEWARRGGQGAFEGGGGGGSGYSDGSITVVDTRLGGSTGNAKIVLRIVT